MADSILDQSVDSLDSETWLILGGDLTHNSPMNRDWAGVADRVGFSCKQVELLQQVTDCRGKGYLFLNTWNDTGESSVRKLLYALLDLKMGAAIKVLRKDKKLSDDDYQTVEAEYDQLKKENKQRFGCVVSDCTFYRALYHRPNSFGTCSFPTPVQTEECQVETSGRDQCASPDFSIEPKTIYISYVSESTFLKSNPTIRKLAEFLHSQSFKVHYKPFCEQEIRNTGGINAWKEHCIQRSENIIVVCTPTYLQEDNKHVSPTTKLSKLSLDSQLLRVLAYSPIPSEKTRLLPISLDSKKATIKDCVPVWLQSSELHHWPSGKIDILRSLLKQPKFKLQKPKPEEMIKVEPIVIGLSKKSRPRKTPK